MTTLKIDIHQDTMKEYIRQKLAPRRYDDYKFWKFKKKELVGNIYKCVIQFY